VSGASLGAAAAAILAGPAAGRFGRKTLLIADAGSYIVALVIFSVFPGSAASTGWRLVLGLGAVPALIGLVLRTQMPESPRWLLRHRRYDEMRKAMKTLGTGDLSDDDIQRAAEIVEQVEGGST
jgi:SP family arabinose:H+ symporter-like MFS transporter